MTYKNFEDWWEEPENWGYRFERFYDSLDNFQSLEGKAANLKNWMRAAFEAGQSSVDHLKKENERLLWQLREQD